MQMISIVVGRRDVFRIVCSSIELNASDVNSLSLARLGSGRDKQYYNVVSAPESDDWKDHGNYNDVRLENVKKVFLNDKAISFEELLTNESFLSLFRDRRGDGSFHYDRKREDGSLDKLVKYIEENRALWLPIKSRFVYRIDGQ